MNHTACIHVMYKTNTCSMLFAVVTPLRKAASYEPRIAILGILGDKWLTRGKNVCGNIW